MAQYLFERGALRGTELMLFEARFVHLGPDFSESTALDAIASVRISFERASRRIGWGIALGIAAIAVFGLAGPSGTQIGRALADVSAQIAREPAQASPVAQFLESALRALEFLVALMPGVALGLFVWGAALAATGWIGYTTLVIALPSTEREFVVPGRDRAFIAFAEDLAEAIADRMRS